MVTGSPWSPVIAEGTEALKRMFSAAWSHEGGLAAGGPLPGLRAERFTQLRQLWVQLDLSN